MQAAEEAGLPDGVDPERLGVLVGTGVGGLDDAAERVPGLAARAATAPSPRTSCR